MQTDQEQFDGLSDVEKLRLATKIIKQKYQGRIIGIENPVFINGAGAREYGMPVKRLSSETLDAKTRASTELDNLIDAGFEFWNEQDGADGHFHKEAIGGFDKRRVLFKIGENYFSGVVNVMNISRGKLFKDVTKIENVTNDIISSYGEKPKSYFVRDISMNIINSPGEKVNPFFAGNRTILCQNHRPR